ncbi:MAG: thioredoxin family protein [Ignavibacteria bacterium]|nr:thioredoxin family protein [Ignavibacteria bacterium]
MQKIFTLTFFIIFIISIIACSEETASQDNEVKVESQLKAKITFVELGSVKCVPCIQMQPIMKSVEAKYGEQIKVIFYDVWTDEGHKYAEIYKIQLIPTQVFLDENEKEIFRHVGFFPEAEIDKFLQEQGLTINN